LAKQTFRDSQPASSDHLAGHDGAAPRPNGGPSGKRGAARGVAAPRASSCERCGGIFSELVDERAYQRPDNYACKTCGAAAHWEESAVRAPRPPDPPSPTVFEGVRDGDLWDGLDLGHPRQAVIGKRYPVKAFDRYSFSTADMGFRDIDGEMLSASEMLGGPRNFGRRANDQSDLVRRHESLDPRSAAVKEWLAGGGWFIQKAGSTGGQVGRPKKGLRGVHLDEAMEQISRTPDWFTYFYEVVKQPAGTIDGSVPHTRGQIRQMHQEFMKRYLMNANPKEAAAYLRVSERKVRRLKAEVVSANSPKGGGAEARFDRVEIRDGKEYKVFVLPDEMRVFVPPSDLKGDVLNVIERIESKVDVLSEQLRAEHDELLRILFEFRYGETPVEAWERVLAEDEAA
jgi:hypothetical protein